MTTKPLNNCWAASPTHVHNKNCYLRPNQLTVIKGGNEPKPWACCDEFRENEEAGEVIATETGYALVRLEPDTDVSYQAIVLDLKYCWSCGTKMPTVKEIYK